MVVLFWLFGRYSGFGELNRCGGLVVCLFWYFSFSFYCLWFGNLIVSFFFLVAPQDVRVFVGCTGSDMPHDCATLCYTLF